MTAVVPPGGQVLTIPCDEDAAALYTQAAAAAVCCFHWQLVWKPDSVERQQLKPTVFVAAWLHLAAPRRT